MKKLWLLLIGVMLFSFSILGWIGTEIFRQAPPIPNQVVTANGTVLIPDGGILDGQNVWQAMGGMQVGSIWGHGSYVAPDWTADYLHRESLFILNEWTGGQFGKDGASLPSEQKAVLRQRLQDLMRTNTYDAVDGHAHARSGPRPAFEDNLKHYSEVFSQGQQRLRHPTRCAIRSGKTAAI